jgi:acyl-CoA hydrolase
MEKQNHSGHFEVYKDCKILVQELCERVGKHIVLGIPIGAGKPNPIVNELYQVTKDNRQRSLDICTALTLNRPTGGSLLEKNFLGPMAERVFSAYPDLDYERDRQHQKLPSNINVFEFYFPPGKLLTNPQAQQSYICSNYTHAARDLSSRGVNVMAQMVASRIINGKRYFSLSCNPDVTLDLMQWMQKERRRGVANCMVAMVNNHLPFMYGDAVVEEGDFDLILDSEELAFPPFGPPKMSVSLVDHWVGLHISALVVDGGEIQVGIGSLGDAVVNSLLLRHKEPQKYNEVLEQTGIRSRNSKILEEVGDTMPFEKGLFSATEMFIDAFFHLIKAGVIKRRVYDDISLQRLLNSGRITETVEASTLTALLQKGAISHPLQQVDVNYLKRFGIFHEEVKWEREALITKDGEKISLDISEKDVFAEIVKKCVRVGERLKGGHILHGGFFLGPNTFYQALKDMPDDERQLINMKSVTAINQLYGHEEIDRLHRIDARFINTCMMMTLSGAAVSDGLSDGRVVSGVGGQYNFVAMAHALPGGRSVINLRSTRISSGKVVSNIVPSYGHITIPRHLRDLVVTEYGIADLRGKTDSEVAQALISIADSRFQDELVQAAKASGKLAKDYQVPVAARNNFPWRLARDLAPYQKLGYFESFPFGTDFTEEEIRIGKALKYLKKIKPLKGKFLKHLGLAVLRGRKTALKYQRYLKRMKLAQPKSVEEKLMQKVLLEALRRTE